MSLLDHPPPPGAPPPDPLDVEVLSDDKLLAELGALEAEQRRLDARRMATLGEVSFRAVTERLEEGASACAGSVRRLASPDL